MDKEAEFAEEWFNIGCEAVKKEVEEFRPSEVTRLVVGDAVYAWNAEKGKIMYCLTGIRNEGKSFTGSNDTSTTGMRGEGKYFIPKMVNNDNQ